jgi:hypothetical protein
LDAGIVIVIGITGIVTGIEPMVNGLDTVALLRVMFGTATASTAKPIR